MGYLVYCILRNREHHGPRIPPGVGGEPVFLVANRGLCAAVSRTPQVKLVADIPRLVAYRKVVESLHRKPTVSGMIPMRYGCLFEEKDQIIELLEKRRGQYEELLDALEGSVEMGIRILVEEPEMTARPSRAGGTEPRTTTPGRTFLNVRKAHYARQEKGAATAEVISRRCLAAFNGLFIKSKAEDHPKAAGTSTLFSLYFLVPEHSVELFRHRFRDFCRREQAKVLLSGPWPPYNFVVPETENR